jgi:hypothetical protein
MSRESVGGEGGVVYVNVCMQWVRVVFASSVGRGVACGEVWEADGEEWMWMWMWSSESKVEWSSRLAAGAAPASLAPSLQASPSLAKDPSLSRDGLRST